MPLNSKNMKKQKASNYIAPGRQNMPMDRRTLVTDATGDKIVRAILQFFTAEEKAQVKANLGITE